MNTTTLTIARFMYAIPMGIFGLFHFMKAPGMSGMVPTWIPGDVFWVYITGAALLLASIAIIINKKARLAALLLGIMLLIFALTIHLPGAASGDQMSSTMFLKDFALSGAAFAFAGILRN